MSRWFRMYDTVPDDPKVQRLSDKAFRAWVNLLCLASRGGGRISGDFDDLAFALRLDRGKAQDLVQVLISAGLIDRIDDCFQPHNWNGRQYKSDVSTERVKRFRKRQETVTATPPDTEQIQKQIQKEEKGCAAPSQALALIDDPVLISLPTNRAGTSYPFLQSQYDTLAPLYPAVDLPQELRAMAAWLISNPKNAKTASGMPRFINNWLSKAQNRSSSNGHVKVSRNDNWLAGAQALARELAADRE